MFGHHFIYDNHSSEEFKLFTASFNQSTDIPLALSRNVLRGEINRYRSNPYHMGTNWDNTLSFTMDLIKDPCSDINDIYFTEDETDDIMAWLTSPDYPILLTHYFTGLIRHTQPAGSIGPFCSSPVFFPL